MRIPELDRRSFLASALAMAVAPGLAAQERPVVLVLTGDDSARTTRIVAAFEKACDFAATMSYQVGDEAAAGAFIADNIRGRPLGLVFAVGNVALKIAARELGGTPVVYAEVGDPSLVGGRADVTGVPTRLEARGVFERLRIVRPGLRRVGFLRAAADQDAWWRRATATAGALGIDTELVDVPGVQEVGAAFESLLSSTELVWIQPDTRLWTGAALSGVFHAARLRRFPVVGFSRAHLDAPEPPAMVAVGHPDSIAAAAAAMARTRLVGAPALVHATVAPMLLGHARGMRDAGLQVIATTTAALDELLGE